MGGYGDREKWEARYRRADNRAPQPAEVLQRYPYLLPETGCALDLAAGRGGNALLLAAHGLETYAWDISPTAMAALDRQALTTGLTVHTETRDVVASPPPPDSFDVITVSRFLDRRLCPLIANALSPGGVLFYQTFIKEKAFPEAGPGNPDYLLEQNELLNLFPHLIIRAYHEEGTLGDTGQGLRNEALLVAQRIPH